MPGRFIVLEGTDGSGKATQLKLLQNWAKKQGFKVKVDDYPHYETTIWGELIGRMQMGEFGDPVKISPYLACLPYMIDEYFGSLQIEKWIKKGFLVLSNRYFTSNVHQVAKLKGRAKAKFRRWLWNAGWQKMKIFRPDLVIVLYIPYEVSRRLILKKEKRSYTKGRRTDLLEKNLLHQKAAAKEYLLMTKMEKNWVLLKCCRRGTLKPPEEIHKEIIRVLKERKII